MLDAPDRPIPGTLLALSAAEERTLDENKVPVRLGRQYRRVQVAADGYDPDAHTVTMAVSSETPVDRWFGAEILSHDKSAIDTSRLKGGVALLFNHDYDLHLGRSESFAIKDGVLRVTSRFGKNPLAVEKEGDVADRILVDVSIGYIVDEWQIEENTKTGERTYTATKWQLLEVSLVTVPADPTVGVGRAAGEEPTPVHYKLRKVDETGQEIAAPAPEPPPAQAAEAARGADQMLTADPPESAHPPLSSAPDTTIPEQQRTQTMASAAVANPNPPAPVQVVADPAAQNAARVAELKQLRTLYPHEFSERELKDAEDLGQSTDTVKSRIFDKRVVAAERSNVPTVSDEVFGGMNESDLSRYSLVGAYRAAVNLSKPGSFRGKDNEGGYEREVGQTLQKKAEERGITGMGSGIVAPSVTNRALAQARAQRALSSGGNAGAATNFTVVDADPIELLRARTVLLTMGARMLTGLHGAIQFTNQTGAGSSNWLLEGNPATETDPTLGEFTMRPNRLSIYNSYYRDLLAQSALAVDGFLSEDRLRVLALALDTAGLAGSGMAPVPMGIMNRTGLAAVLSGSTRNQTTGAATAGAGGVPMTYVDFNNMEAAISSANADIGTLGIITTPRVRAAARSTPILPGTASGMVWPNSKVDARGVQDGPLGYPSSTTTNSVLTGFTANGVSGLHAVLMGVFNQILFGDWGLSEIVVDNVTGAAQAQYKITEHAYYDCNVRQLPAFCLCTSALPQ